MTRAKRSNFSDITKAQIYARDKGICAFCGTDLWTIRLGTCLFAKTDWTDHILPSSRRGDNAIENGMCLCNSCNQKKGANTRDKEYFFSEGKPTWDYLQRFDQLNPIVEATLQANAQLHWTDWYFNKAVTSLGIAVANLWDTRCGFSPYVRGPEDWARAALRKYAVWKTLAQREQVPSLRKRGLLLYPLRDEQKRILKALESTDEDEFLRRCRLLLPHFAGHLAFGLCKQSFFEDSELRTQLMRINSSSLQAGIEDFLAQPFLISHPLGQELIDYGIACKSNGHLKPKGYKHWPPFPLFRFKALLGRNSD